MKNISRSTGLGRRFFLFVGLTVLAALGSSDRLSGNPSRDSLAAEVTDDSFEKEVLKSKVPVLVDLWAVWCGPCRMYGPIVEKVAKDYEGKLKVVRVDVDKNPRLSRDYQIRAIPTTLLFRKGKLVKTWVGLVPESDLKREVNKIVKPIRKAEPAK